LYFDHMISSRALAEISPLTPEQVYRRVHQPHVEGRYDAGELSTAEFIALLREVLDIPAQVPDERIEHAWADIFWENKPVSRLLPKLQSSYALVLLSNTNKLHFRFARLHFPVLAYFNHFVLSYEVGHCKPEPEIFQEALRRTHARPVEAVYVDDIAEYAQAAHRLGIHAIHYVPGETDFAKQLQALGIRV